MGGDKFIEGTVFYPATKGKLDERQLSVAHQFIDGGTPAT